MEAILSNLPPPGLFLSTLLGMRVLKTLLAAVALSCVTTSVSTTTQAMKTACGEEGPGSSSLVQPGQKGKQPWLCGDWRKESKAGQAKPSVMSCREEPAQTNSARGLLAASVSPHDSVAGPQDTLQSRAVTF